MMNGSVLAISIAAEAGGEPHPVDVAALVAGRGIVGDRYYRGIGTFSEKLNDLVGHRFRVGDAVLEGVRPCEPCAHLATQLGIDVAKSMVHRAGLRARIISGADIRPGDHVASDVESADA
jgi:hypothetical protein